MALAGSVLVELVLAAVALEESVWVQKDTNAGHNYFRNDLGSAHNTRLHGSQHLLHIQEPQNNRCQIQKVLAALVMAALVMVVMAMGRHHILLAPAP